MKKKSAVSAADTKLQVVLNRLPHEKVRCLDLETSGLDWRRCHVVGYVLTFSGDPRDSYYIPFRHAGSGNVGGVSGPQERHGGDGSTSTAERALLDALDAPETICFGHNLAFDLKFAWQLGMRKLLPRFEDTIINAPLLDEWQGKFSLEYCANLARVFAKKGAEIARHVLEHFPDDCSLDGRGDRAPMAHFWRLDGDDPVAVEYAEGDGTSTWQLRDWQTPQIEEEHFVNRRASDQTHSLKQVWDIESRLIPVLNRMSMVGVKVNEEKLNALIKHCEDRVGQLLENFPKDFNVRSPGDVKAWCESHGQTDWPFTPGRMQNVGGVKQRVPAPSFPESWLKEHDAGRPIVEIRKLETLRTTFFQPLRDEHLWKGRVHTSFNQLRGDEYGTVTGRLSASEPNLTAVSKHDYEIGKMHRSVFEPDEGMLWASADYRQIEPVLMAFYARAKVLLDGFRATPPIDAHTAVSMAANRNWPNMTPAERKKYRDEFGKRINQTIVTGGGAGVLVSKYKVPAGEVEEMLREYHRSMPELKPFQKRASKRFEERGYMISLLGRMMRLNDRNKSYTAMNRLLQGGNADILKLKMVEIDEYLAREGRPLDMLLSIHDDLGFQFPLEQAHHLARCLEIMTDFGEGQLIELDLPIGVDVGVGKNWAEATYDHKTLEDWTHGDGTTATGPALLSTGLRVV